MRSMELRRRQYTNPYGDLISISKKVSSEEMKLEKDPESMSEKELQAAIKDINKKMKKAAAELNFEVAAELRDQANRI